MQNTPHILYIIGERERANLVVQLARFFYNISRSLRAPIPNVNVILQCWMQCACAVVARHVRAPSVLQLALRLLQLAAFACLLASIHNLYIQVTSSCISLLSTPLSFFAVYYLDRSRSPTMFRIYEHTSVCKQHMAARQAGPVPLRASLRV